MTDKLELTFLGYHWEASGDLFYLTHEDGRQARVFVDSLGETWVDIRRKPAGGYFHSEQVEAFLPAVQLAAQGVRDAARSLPSDDPALDPLLRPALVQAAIQLDAALRRIGMRRFAHGCSQALATATRASGTTNSCSG